MQLLPRAPAKASSGGCRVASCDPPGFWMEWNAENQLTRVTKDSAEVATFAYDPLGRRVEKVAGGVTTAYAYDGEDILRETRTGGTVFKYVHGPRIDEPLGREDQTTALEYYHADALGSILKRSTQSGSTVHEYRYDAWGNIELGAAEPGKAFTGRDWDPETGLHYYRARYHEPSLGVFLSEDPLSFRGARGLYAYVDNDPVNATDPFGLLPVTYPDPEPGTSVPPVPPINMSCKRALENAYHLAWQASRWEINDHHAHCLAHCWVVRACGRTAYEFSPVFGYTWEAIQCVVRHGGKGPLFQKGDICANETGRTCPAGQPCEDCCRPTSDPNVCKPDE